MIRRPRSPLRRVRPSKDATRSRSLPTWRPVQTATRPPRARTRWTTKRSSAARARGTIRVDRRHGQGHLGSAGHRSDDRGGSTDRHTGAHRRHRQRHRPHGGAHGPVGQSQGPVQAAVVGGRWLRDRPTAAVDARSKKPRAATAQVTYDDGGRPRLVTGTVAVTLFRALTRDLPVTTADTAAVRTGDSVRVPVIANDTSPAGRCSRCRQRSRAPRQAGQPPVTDVADPKSTDVGTAYVPERHPLRAGRCHGCPHRRHPVCRDDTGGRRGGRHADGHDPASHRPRRTVTRRRLRRTSRPGQPPAKTITIPVTPSGRRPRWGLDDRRRIASAPEARAHHRVQPTSLTSGLSDGGRTDVFRYVVSDLRGGRNRHGPGRRHPPQPPQPPVAIPDQITAAPGAHVTINPGRQRPRLARRL